MAAEIFEGFKDRLHLYTEAMKKPPANPDIGPIWELGKAFSKACGADELADLLFIGIISFGSSVGSLQILLKDMTVTGIRY